MPPSSSAPPAESLGQLCGLTDRPLNQSTFLTRKEDQALDKKDYSTLPTKATKAPKPFTINIPEQQIQELKTLLKYSRIPEVTYESLDEGVDGVGRFGVSRSWIVRARDRWLGEDGEEKAFDWRKCEDNINSFPNFKSQVKIETGDFEIHFAALLSEREDAIPVILLHGWPGSFLEFLPMLALYKKQYTPQTLPYHFIVPSMPGYAFSAAPPLDRELDILEVPTVFNQLMVDLGFGDGYVAQGGDIGSRIARILAVRFESCKAVHLNYSPIAQPSGFSHSSLSVREREGLLRGQEFVKSGTGYSLEHATRPSTIGLILSSSPLALLAWIGEKFLAWSDVSPDLDTILEGVMLYWVTESGGRGVYPYRQKPPSGLSAAENPDFHIKKPLGYSYFPKEISPMPSTWVATTGNLVFSRQHDKGGHFAALEQPGLLKGDLEEFVGQVWKR